MTVVTVMRPKVQAAITSVLSTHIGQPVGLLAALTRVGDTLIVLRIAAETPTFAVSENDLCIIAPGRGEPLGILLAVTSQDKPLALRIEAGAPTVEITDNAVVHPLASMPFQWIARAKEKPLKFTLKSAKLRLYANAPRVAVSENVTSELLPITAIVTGIGVRASVDYDEDRAAEEIEILFAVIKWSESRENSWLGR